MIRVFIAAPLARGRHASIIAGALRVNFDVTSTWHDNLNGYPKDPRDEEERLSKLSTNLSAIERSDVLVALLHDGEPRCTFFEIGYACARGGAVVCVHDSGAGRFLGDAHALVVKLDLRRQSLEDLPLAIETAAGLVGIDIHQRDTMPDLVAPEGRMERGLENA